jgi:hypothetical protein
MPESFAQKDNRRPNAPVEVQQARVLPIHIYAERGRLARKAPSGAQLFGCWFREAIALSSELRCSGLIMA